VASYGLGQVSKGTKYPQLAFANVIALIVIITILYAPRPAPKAKYNQQSTKMMPKTITCLFKEAHDSFPLLEGKPSNDDLLAIWDTFLPLLMVIPYNQLNRAHSLTAILTKAIKYKANHGAKFVRLARLPLYNKLIASNATPVTRVHAEATHKSQLNDYASYEAAERSVANFFHDVVDKIWYNDLKDANTFYTKVTALKIMAHLNANCGGLHAIDMITLRMNMTQYYMQANGTPQFIVMMRDAQKKAMRASVPIVDIKLIMMALVAVLVAEHFPRKVDWEGLPTKAHTWQAWMVAFCLAHLKRQRQLQASEGGKPLGGAHAVIPASTPIIDHICAALKNMVLVASNDTTVLQQLTAANLSLTALVTSLTMANKKLVDAFARKKGVPLLAVAPTMRGGCSTNKPLPGNYY
jgi:hypothetical protein